MTPFDAAWAREVVELCDPVFQAAHVGFVSHGTGVDGDVAGALLWEADPAQFEQAYPDSGIAASYGADWASVTCIDFWVYPEHDQRCARLSIEGFNLPDLWLPLESSTTLHAMGIADTFARILGVRSPRVG